MTWPTDPPEVDTIEISTFGKGIGECVVVHAGGGDWLVVDSFVEPASGLPVALEYLSRIGVDVAAAVKLVVATHWHADHTGGLSSLFGEARSARMAFSQALKSREFAALLGADATLGEEQSSLRELRRSLDIIQDRRQTPMWAVENRRLLNTTQGDIYSLSPSDDAISAALEEIGLLLPTAGAPKRRLTRIQPNDTCVVISIRWRERRVLLGADLEKGGRPTRGWKAIVNSTAPPHSISAQMLKVSHHGSEGAHEDSAWSTLLAPDPVAVVTPYRALSNPLPTPADVRRISALTSQFFCAGSRHAVKGPSRPATVDKLLGKKIRVIDGRVGHVRVRFGQAGPAKVDLFGAAERMQPA